MTAVESDPAALISIDALEIDSGERFSSCVSNYPFQFTRTGGLIPVKCNRVFY